MIAGDQFCHAEHLKWSSESLVKQYCRSVQLSPPYSTMLNFGVLLLVAIDHVTRQCLSSVASFAENLVLHDKNNRVLLSQALHVIGFLRNLMFKLHICCEHEIFLGHPIT